MLCTTWRLAHGAGYQQQFTHISRSREKTKPTDASLRLLNGPTDLQVSECAQDSRVLAELSNAKTLIGYPMKLFEGRCVWNPLTCRRANVPSAAMCSLDCTC